MPVDCAAQLAYADRVASIQAITSSFPATRNAADSARYYAVRCFPHASPVFVASPGKQFSAPAASANLLVSLKKNGAGEGIRTLDPDLGKVVLYP